MSESYTLTSRRDRSESCPGSLFERWCRQLAHRNLAGLRHGTITILEAGRESRFGSSQARGELAARVHVNDPAFYRRLVLGGSVGAAESYMDGDWTCDDLVVLVRILVLNFDVLQGTERGWARLGTALHRLFHVRRKNTTGNSRRNIAEHYDLSNAFFALFLDETMTYSAGIFERPDSTLSEASVAKYDRICRKLDLQPSDHVLEIGTGWGGFAIHAASRYGCRVTTTTISREQHELARRRVRDAGLEGRVTLLLQDYRELSGKYDKLVSIEMIEAVGHHYYDRFMQVCGDLLKQDGLAAIQAITIADQHFDGHTRNADFIKRYVFPGSCIPSITRLTAAMTTASDLRLAHLEDITPHYARTLRLWRERFLDQLPNVRALGFSDRFIRMWEYYLCYCEGGFAERYIGAVQMVLAKPGNRRDPILPQIPGTTGSGA